MKIDHSLYSQKSVVHLNDSVSRIYYKKLMGLFLLIGFFTIVTKACFLSEFMVTYLSGFIALSFFFNKKNIFKQSHYLFFLGLLYCILPSFLPLSIFAISGFSLIIVCEVFFKNLNGFFVHPVLIIFLLIVPLINLNKYFIISYVQTDFFPNYFYTFSQHIGNYAHPFFFSFFGFYFLSPSNFAGGVLLIFLFFSSSYHISLRKVLILLFSVLSILFLYQLINSDFVLNKTLRNYVEILSTQVFNSPLLFIGIFLSTENLIAPFSITGKYLFTVLVGMFMSLFYIVGFSYFAPFFGLFLAQLTSPILEKGLYYRYKKNG